MSGYFRLVQLIPGYISSGQVVMLCHVRSDYIRLEQLRPD